jgi:Zn-finger nucleic acid-binding protein
MQCPTDGTVLVMSERSGIEIDYCPSCRGVWLDRGELDKIIDRSLTQSEAAAPPAPPGPAPLPHQDSGYQRPGYQEPKYADPRYRKKRKESWLSEIFD